MKETGGITDGRARRVTAVAASFAAGLALGVAATLGAGLLTPKQTTASVPNRSEPMAYSVMPDGSKVFTYVHIDPDTGQQLYITSTGGIYPRDTSRLNGSTADSNAVTVYDLAEGHDDEG